ncbi:MAG: hypothetical protein L6W00_23700 [Lentisphaeria bacterium]|nr:MAG: hypothetical protein L6W00_23700 [Lentisphaeria bacterium]
MPLKWGYAFSDFLFRMLFFIDLRHRRRSIQHLMHAGIAANHREAVRMAAASIREFGKLLVEIVKMDQLYSPEKITVSGDAEALDYVLSPDHENHQVIIITAHFGNWEVAGEAFSEKARRPMLSMMRSFGNPLIGRMILAHRAGKMHELVDKTEESARYCEPSTRARTSPCSSINTPPAAKASNAPSSAIPPGFI